MTLLLLFGSQGITIMRIVLVRARSTVMGVPARTVHGVPARDDGLGVPGRSTRGVPARGEELEVTV